MEDVPRDWSTTSFKVRRRVFRKSLKLYFYLLWKFAGPVFGIIFYITTLWGWTSVVMSGVQNVKDEVYYAQQRRVLVRTPAFRVVFLCFLCAIVCLCVFVCADTPV